MVSLLIMFFAAVFLQFFHPTSALAWTAPSTVKVVVGQSPGSGNELAFRGIHAVLEKNNPGTRFIFEYRPGMDNVIAMNHLASQDPDGKTILVLVQVSGMVVAPVAFKNYLKVDPMTYQFVTTIAKAPMAFIVPSNSKFKNVNDLIHQARDPKNKINIGISGSINQLAYSFFVEKSGLSADVVRPIRYNSATEASVAVSGGFIDVAIVPLSVPKPFIDSNRIKLLAHTGSEKIPGTTTELMKDHIKDFVLEAAWSVFLPPDTPEDIVHWYSKQIILALQQPDVKNFYANRWISMDESLLGPLGLASSIETARRTWLPIAHKVIEVQK